MKNLISFFILLAVSGCKKTPETPANYDFKINTSRSIGTSTLVLKSIRDSRCPINADCISAGGVQAFFKLTTDNTDREITLCKGVCGPLESSTTIKIDGINYSLKLINVTPYPQLQKSDNTQTVKVELTRT
ncbi:hypothetical protein [Pedobacter zeae]|uniref:Lipoprotein n=1 Tax=Pedobacter zeae TaxID=1737356 RepID=A0A7W6P3U4_9SPHI|nr:hypothetical protein [Pedobacter zeae]MBB4106118.1 hypothetical protein [Pedobacter zeae]GGG99601.1 hypothetical protein GCM10007422_12500 [Pedobacter zeae]